jgi:hypothetical protein
VLAIPPVDCAASTLVTEFGTSVVGAGDVDHDGYGDIAVQAPNSLYPANSPFSTYVYRGSASGLAAAPSARLVAGQLGGAFCHEPGCASVAAGDFNGDRMSDLALLSGGYVAKVYLGSSSGLADPPSAALSMWRVIADGPAGALAAADVNGDGRADLISSNATTPTNEFGFGVFLGSARGVEPTPDLIRHAPLPIGACCALGYGLSLANAGDVDGDGFSDVVVGYGNAGSTTGAVLPGAAYVFRGGAAGLAGTAWATLFAPDYPRVAAQFGNAVAGAGDVNRDGFADVVVGARGLAISATMLPGRSTGTYGAIHVFAGAPSLAPTPTTVVNAVAGEEGFGKIGRAHV